MSTPIEANYQRVVIKFVENQVPELIKELKQLGEDIRLLNAEIIALREMVIRV